MGEEEKKKAELDAMLKQGQADQIIDLFLNDAFTPGIDDSPDVFVNPVLAYIVSIERAELKEQEAKEGEGEEGAKQEEEKPPEDNHPPELKCSICNLLFLDPMELPCGHYFCNECILDTWQVTAKMSCPTCDKPTWKRQMKPKADLAA